MHEQVAAEVLEGLSTLMRLRRSPNSHRRGLPTRRAIDASARKAIFGAMEDDRDHDILDILRFMADSAGRTHDARTSLSLGKA